MGLFGGKKGVEEEEKSSRKARPQSRPKKKDSSDKKKKKKNKSSKDERRKAKNELLNSVLDESVPGAALTELRANPAFDTVRDGNPYHIALMLNVDDIGGLSRKVVSRDADKGAILECITSGRIKVLTTGKLMDANRFILIPDDATLDSMDEFTILRTAPYTAAWIEDVGHDSFSRIDEGPTSPISISYDDARAVSNGDFTIDEMLQTRQETPSDIGQTQVIDTLPSADGRDIPVNHTAIDKPEEKFDSSTDSLPELEEEDFFVDDVIEDDLPEFEEIDIIEPMPEQPAVEQVVSEQTTEEAPSDVVEETESEILFEEEQPADNDVVEEVAVEEVVETAPVETEEEKSADFDAFAKSMNRIFYAADLPFEVTMEPFDNMFRYNNEAPSFDENRGNGWLAEQLSQMSKDANADLKRLHNDNLTYLSQRYSHLMGLYIDGLVRRINLSDQSNKFGAVKNSIDQSHKNDENRVNEIVDERLEEIKNNFEEGVRQAGENARVRAEAQYRQRHEHDYEEKRSREALNVRSEIDLDYRRAMKELLDSRREEAATRIDYGVTQILAVLHQQYDELKREEMERFDTYRESFSKWLDDNRQEDIAYAKALAEEQRQGEKSERLRQEYEQQFQAQAAAFEKRKVQLEGEIEDVKRDRDAKLEAIEARLEERVRRAEDDRDAANDRLRDAMERYNSLGDAKDKEYEQRIAALKDAREADNIRYDSLSKQHKTTSILWVAIAIIGIICSFSVGMLMGFNQNVAEFTNSTIQAVQMSEDTSMVSDWLNI